jgi:glycosyltransferase involved in cell wall biosynthesis
MMVRIAAARYRTRGAKVLYTTHGFSFTSKSSWKSKLVYQTCEILCSKFCDAIITINKEDYAAAKKMFAPRVYYIHGVGVDISQYQNVEIDRIAYRASIGVKEDEVMLLGVGELSERKNHAIIIEALERISSNKKYVYVICGNGINGGTGAQLQELALKKQINLKLLGFRHDIPQITKCSDLGVLPSVREGLGLAGIQSLAAGIPVVGTDVQGIRDYIVCDSTGYLCDAFDADGFARAIEKLTSMGELKREKMSQRCVAMAKQFDVCVSRKEMETIYREVLPK